MRFVIANARNPERVAMRESGICYIQVTVPAPTAIGPELQPHQLRSWKRVFFQARPHFVLQTPSGPLHLGYTGETPSVLCPRKVRSFAACTYVKQAATARYQRRALDLRFRRVGFLPRQLECESSQNISNQLKAVTNTAMAHDPMPHASPTTTTMIALPVSFGLSSTVLKSQERAYAEDDKGERLAGAA